jgi:hypothetical protein
MKKTTTITFLILLAALITSCNTTSSGNHTGKSHFKATITGAVKMNLSGAAEYASNVPSITLIYQGKSHKQVISIGFAIDPKQPIQTGTFPIVSLTDGSLTMKSKDHYAALYFPCWPKMNCSPQRFTSVQGDINIISVTSQTVKGTFHFIALPTNKDSVGVIKGAPSIKVQGRFRASQTNNPLNINRKYF